MPLSEWGGLAHGISRGINNIATLEHMESQQKRDALIGRRAEQEDTEFKQRQAEYDRLNAPAGTLEENMRNYGLLDADHKEAVQKVSTLLGVDPNTPLRAKDKMAIGQFMAKSPEITQLLLDKKRAALGSEVNSLGEKLIQQKEAAAGGFTDYDSSVKPIEDTIKAKQEQINRLNMLDPVYLAQEKEKREQRELEIKETVANKPQYVSPSRRDYVDRQGNTHLIDRNDPDAQAYIRKYKLTPYTKPDKTGAPKTGNPATKPVADRTQLTPANKIAIQKQVDDFFNKQRDLKGRIVKGKGVGGGDIYYTAKEEVELRKEEFNRRVNNALNAGQGTIGGAVQPPPPDTNYNVKSYQDFKRIAASIPKEQVNQFAETYGKKYPQYWNALMVEAERSRRK